VGLAIVAATFDDLEVLPLERMTLTRDGCLLVVFIRHRMGSG
jgi:hypothetical protein